MSSADTLKQAAQALRQDYGDSMFDHERTENAKLAAALEEMAAQEPVGHVFTMEGLDGKHDKKYHAILYRPLPRGTNLYAAPIATSEHDAKVRNAALEDAAKVCMTYSAERAELYGYGERSTEAEICADRIRSLKSIGATS